MLMLVKMFAQALLICCDMLMLVKMFVCVDVHVCVCVCVCVCVSVSACMFACARGGFVFQPKSEQIVSCYSTAELQIYTFGMESKHPFMQAWRVAIWWRIRLRSVPGSGFPKRRRLARPKRVATWGGSVPWPDRSEKQRLLRKGLQRQHHHTSSNLCLCTLSTSSEGRVLGRLHWLSTCPTASWLPSWWLSLPSFVAGRLVMPVSWLLSWPSLLSRLWAWWREINLQNGWHLCKPNVDDHASLLQLNWNARGMLITVCVCMCVCDQNCCNLCGFLYVSVTIWVVDVIDVSLVLVMNKNQQGRASIYVNAQLFFSTLRNAAPAVLTVMVGPVLWGALSTVLLSRRPCRCKREETSLWRRRTCERRPFLFMCSINTISVWWKPQSRTVWRHNEKRTNVACSLLHGCLNMYGSQSVSMCNAMKTYSMHHLFYERRLMWYDCPCTRYDEEVVDLKVFVNTEFQRS